tara:strand:- start:213 stop:665 length:453 start_codon:yes stop_codon:yes gene_type:complete
MPLFILIFISLLSFSCTTSVQKSGKIDSDKYLMEFKDLNKIQIIEILGEPSSIDSLTNSYIYISEVAETKNIFNKKIISRNIYVIKFDQNDSYQNINQYEINSGNEITISKKITNDEIIKTGYIEKIFGGVGKKQSLESAIPKTKIAGQN